MKKHKKTGQNRKKHRKSSPWEIKTSGYLQPSFLLVHKNVILALVLLLVVFTTVDGAFYVKLLLQTDEKPKLTKQPPVKTEEQVLIPVIEPLATEQDVAALKKKELDLAEKLNKDFPGNDDALVVMGNLWLRHGNAVEGLKYLNKALEINPKRTDVYKSMGWLFLKKGELEKSIGHYRKALDIEPQLSDVRSNLGHALMMSGRHDEAIKELEKQVEILPSSDFACFLLGQIYLLKEEYQKAKENYEAAIRIRPNYTNAYYGLTTVCTKLGNREKVKEYSEKFKKLKADGRKSLKGRKVEYNDFFQTQRSAAITYINVGRMYRENGKLDEAEEQLKQAAGLDTENVICFIELASLYQAKRQPAKTLQMYQKVRDLQPESPISYLMIGILSAHLKRFGDAEEAFSKMITLAPRKSDGYRELARLYLKTGRKLTQARQLAGKAVTLGRTAPNYFVFGWACYAAGDTTNALAAVKRAVELDPDNSQYKLLYKQIQQRK